MTLFTKEDTQMSFEQITALADEWRVKEAEVRALEAQVKVLSGRMREIEFVQLPELFLQNGVQSYTTTSGAKLTLGQMVSAKFPKEDEQRNAAIEWLMQAGHGDVVKAQVVASWPAGEAEHAEQMMQSLNGDSSVVATLDKFVHPSTLGKLVREMLVGGEDVPLNTLGVTVQSRVKID